MKLRNLIIFIFCFPSLVFAQNNEFIPSGKPFATIHLNFHKGISSASREDVAFELTRAYLGYEYHISSEFYVKINVDVGSPGDLSPYSKARRYAYFKNAFLRNTKKELKVDFGLIDTKQFKILPENVYFEKTTVGKRTIILTDFRFTGSTILPKNTSFLPGTTFFTRILLKTK